MISPPDKFQYLNTADQLFNILVITWKAEIICKLPKGFPDVSQVKLNLLDGRRYKFTQHQVGINKKLRDNGISKISYN
jgi:hypothetical protein